MANYAIVKSGVVDNIIVSEAPFAIKIGAVLLPDGYGMGDKYDGRTWTKAPRPEAPDIIADESELDALRRQLEELRAKISEMEADNSLKQELDTVKETVLELIGMSGGEK